MLVVVMNETDRLFACLKMVGINPKMETFSERKRVQKMVYLLDKVFHLNFGFSYNWYLHGPYSPELTRIIFDVIEKEREDIAKPAPLSTADKAKIARLKLFLNDDIESTDTLELLVSLHYLLNCWPESDSRVENAVNFLKSKKPYFSDEEISNALKRLQDLENQ
jgi:uncharacterized protein YwgA